MKENTHEVRDDFSRRNDLDQSRFHHHGCFHWKESNINLYGTREFHASVRSLITCRSWKIPPVGTSFAGTTSTGQCSPLSFCSKIWTQNSTFLVTSLHLGHSWGSWKIIHFYFNTSSLGPYTWEWTRKMTSKQNNSVIIRVLCSSMRITQVHPSKCDWK